MKKRWLLFPSQKEKAKELAHQLNISPILAQIFINRKITSPEAAERFLNPSLDALYSPFLLPDIEKALARLNKAKKNKEKVLIYGDYDVDGISATVLLVQFFKKLGFEVGYYIPHRIEEGYGLNKEAITWAREENYKLLLTVDCGISAFEEVAYANSLGLEVIITDHHEPGDKLPEAIAIVSPKRLDAKYPERNLSGVGLAYKLASAYAEQEKVDFPPTSYLEFVTLGTIGDVVSILDENRILVKYGLKELAKTQNVGLRELMKTSGLWGKKINSYHVSFILAPRINALGRLGEASRNIELFLTTDSSRASQIAQELETENKKRQEVEKRILEEVVFQLEANETLLKNPILVLSSSTWHPGVVGIVASQIAERYWRPTLLICLDAQGNGRGSGRSIKGFHLYQALFHSREFLEGFGGHEQACGLRIKKDKIAPFIKEITQYAQRVVDTEILTPSLSIELELNLSELNFTLLDELELLAPFGVGNPRAVFLASGLRIVGEPKIVGNNHLKFTVEQKGRFFEVIGYGLGEAKSKFISGKVDLAFTPEVNDFGGVKTIQLKAVDFRVKASTLFLEKKLTLEEEKFLETLSQKGLSILNGNRVKAEKNKSWEETPSVSFSTNQELEVKIKSILINGGEFRVDQREVIQEILSRRSCFFVTPPARGKQTLAFYLALRAILGEKKNALLVYPSPFITKITIEELKSKVHSLGIKILALDELSLRDNQKEGILTLTSGEASLFLTSIHSLESLKSLFPEIKPYLGLVVFNEIARDSSFNFLERVGVISKLLGEIPILVESTIPYPEIPLKKIVAPTPRAVLKVIDKREIKNKIDYLLETIREGVKTIIYTPSWEESLRVFAALKKRLGGIFFKCGVSYYNQLLNWEERRKIQNLFQRDKLLTLITPFVFKIGNGFSQDIIFLSLPLNFWQFIYLTSWGECRIHLLFGKEDIPFTRRVLEETYPHRQMLEKIYLTFKNSGETAEAILKQKGFSEELISSGISILEELDLAKVSSSRVKIVTPSEKKSLKNSIKYLIGESEKRAFQEFSEFILEASSERITQVLTTGQL